MATAAVTTAPTAPSPQLCDYCHQKPKFSNHLYCSKTCAGQAATLCNHCHKKPKFQNFEYCGKNCAALANANGTAGKARNAPVGAGAQPKGKGQQQQQAAAAPAFDPIQIAKLVAQHIPQVQALLNPQAANNATVPQAAVIPTAQVQPAQAIPPHLNINNPFLDPAQQAQLQQQMQMQQQAQAAAAAAAQQQAQPTGNGAVTHSLASASSLLFSGTQTDFFQVSTGNQQAADDLECIIPGCGKPVHVNAKGMKASEYCSMRCRE
ncbi:hypothetical protein D9613_007446 [Agrocybe pediades]|uniref:Uncharacterized protein n=1 Tax=Agrocybe pediades TaxID=84607 RepID=A0A8H4QNJ2_9AGAR|nr:hypothetical protein D9613_007446 [Agrocybe pediades]